MRTLLIQIAFLTFAFMGVLAVLRVKLALRFWRRARVLGYIYVVAVLASAVVHYFVWLQ